MEDGIRLNKYLSAVGFCSRREADRLIETGKVYIDGQQAFVGMKVCKDQEIIVDGHTIERADGERILLLVNKPAGIVCTTAQQEQDNIIDYLHYPKRIYPIGRLDKDSRGLLLMTNVGELHNEITRVSYGHEKEYIVTVDRRIESTFVKKMSQGVYIPELDYQTMPAKVKKLSQRSFSIVLKEGKNRQIRRMCKALSYRVHDLQRIRIMHFTLKDIKEGMYRSATDDEWGILMRTVKADF